MSVSVFLAGQSEICSGCGAEVSVPDPPGEPSTAVEAAPTAEGQVWPSQAVPPGPDSLAFKQCRKCGKPLPPRNRRCPKCRALTGPIFLWILPPIVALLGVWSFVMAIIGGIETNELPQAMGVMIPVLLVSIAASLGLWFGRAGGWHFWTVLLGLGILGAFVFMIMATGSDADPPGGRMAMYVLATLIYVGIAWRTVDRKKWWWVSGGYLAIVSLVSLSVIVTYCDQACIGPVIGVLVYWLILAGLVIVTYSLGVRWWCRVRLGWTGGYIEQLAP